MFVAEQEIFLSDGRRSNILNSTENAKEANGGPTESKRLRPMGSAVAIRCPQTNVEASVSVKFASPNGPTDATGFKNCKIYHDNRSGC